MKAEIASGLAAAYVCSLAKGIQVSAVVEEIVDIQHMIEELKRQRRVLALQIRLAEPKLKEDWDRLEQKWEAMRRKGSDVLQASEDSSDDIWVAVLSLRDELKLGYERIKNAL